jgi:23S rRNA G2445 N2-methylase RlmL
MHDGPPASAPAYLATVPGGWEFLTAEELRDRVAPLWVQPRQGTVLFAAAAPLDQLLALRSVFRLFAFVGRVGGLPADNSALEHMPQHATTFDWESALRIWRTRFPQAPPRPSFRVTARRSGAHEFQSMQVAAALGSAVQRRFGWPVDLEHFDLEIQALVVDDELLVGLALTHASLHHERRLVHGRADLKTPLAHGLARLARIQPGDTVLDPMCGVATIAVEAALNWPQARYLASDLDRDELRRAVQLLRATEAPVQLLRADARRLPLASESIDAVVCDMPFGRRVGSHRANRRLYPAALREMHRVLRPQGRAVLLTLERRLTQRLLSDELGWQVEAVHPVWHGGLQPRAYVVRRV